jgi:hypothetical protein
LFPSFLERHPSDGVLFGVEWNRLHQQTVAENKTNVAGIGFVFTPTSNLLPSGGDIA